MIVEDPTPYGLLHSDTLSERLFNIHDVMIPHVQSMTQIVLVGLGGMIGSICRFLLSDFVQRLSPILGYPFGTLVVNVVGCFLIGLLNGVTDVRQLFLSDIRPFLFIGVLGGFTTYSTFGYETFAFLRDGQYSQVLLIIGSHLFVGLGAVWLGDTLGRLA